MVKFSPNGLGAEEGKLINQKDFSFEVNFSNVVSSLRDALVKRGFSIFTRGNPKDQYVRLVKEGTVELIFRMQLEGKHTKISLVSSKFNNVEQAQKEKFVEQLWQIIDSAAPRDVKAVAKSPPVASLIRDNLARYGALDIEKFAADTGNELPLVVSAAESISDGKQFVLTEDRRRLLARGKVREMVLGGLKPAKSEATASPSPVCPKCGLRSKPNAFFCSGCGTRLRA
jgi:hypothetical protein